MANANAAGNRAVQTLTITQILTHIGFTVEANRDIVKADLMPNGLTDMVNQNIKRLQETCHAYASRANGAFEVTDAQFSYLVGLIHLTTRNYKIGMATQFLSTHTGAVVLDRLRKAMQWQHGLKARITRGNTWLNKQLDTKLDTQVQWLQWYTDIERILSMIIGERGIAIVYVIRVNATSTDAAGPTATFAQRAYHLAPVDPNDEMFVSDTETVHNVVIDNLVDKGAAMGYVKKLKKHKNGRMDVEELRKRFEAAGVKNSLVTKAENDLKTLVYKSERAMTFEQFCAKLLTCYETLQENNCVRNDNEKIKDLWPKIQAPFLLSAKTSLMTSHTLNNITFEAVLDQFAILIPQLQNGVAGMQARINALGVDVSSTAIVHTGEAPWSSVFTPEGALFTGNYTKEQWRSESVVPHHEAIKQARAEHRIANGGRAGKRKQQHSKKQANEYKKVRRENKKLRASISSLETRISALGAIVPPGGGDKTPSPNNNAGDAFGGRRSMAGKKGDNG